MKLLSIWISQDDIQYDPDPIKWVYNWHLGESVNRRFLNKYDIIRNTQSRSFLAVF